MKRDQMTSWSSGPEQNKWASLSLWKHYAGQHSLVWGSRSIEKGRSLGGMILAVLILNGREGAQAQGRNLFEHLLDIQL